MIKINVELEGAKRWYDNDATVSLAISILRNSNHDKQILASRKIVEIAKSYDIKLKDVSIYVRTFRRRWYDYDEELCSAMECLKDASSEIQKSIAIDVINYLCELQD